MTQANENKTANQFSSTLDKIKIGFKSIIKWIKNNWQLLSYGFVILVAIVFLIYALGYSTSWNQAETYPRLRDSVVHLTRDINIGLVSATLILLVAAVLGLAFGSHNRKKYYISNYVIAVVVTVLLVYTTYLFFNAYNTLQPVFYDSLYNNASDQADWGRVFNGLHLIGSHLKEADIPAEFTGTLGEYRREYALLVGREGVMASFNFTYFVYALATLAIIANLAIPISKAVVLREQIRQKKYRQEIIAYADRKVLDREEIVYNTAAPQVEMISTDLNLDIADKIQADDLEITKVDKLRYQNNSLSYFLILLSLLSFLLGLFQTINFTMGTGTAGDMRVIPDAMTALFIAIGIAMMLITFLTAEKVKVYNLGWTVATFGLSLVHLWAMLSVPIQLYNKGEIPGGTLTTIIIAYSVAIVLLVIAGIVGYIKTVSLKKHLKELGEV